MRGRHATSLRSNSNDIAVYSPRCAPAQLLAVTLYEAHLVMTLSVLASRTACEDNTRRKIGHGW